MDNGLEYKKSANDFILFRKFVMVTNNLFTYLSTSMKLYFRLFENFHIKLKQIYIWLNYLPLECWKTFGNWFNIIFWLQATQYFIYWFMLSFLCIIKYINMTFFIICSTRISFIAIVMYYFHNLYNCNYTW